MAQDVYPIAHTLTIVEPIWPKVSKSIKISDSKVHTCIYVHSKCRDTCHFLYGWSKTQSILTFDWIPGADTFFGIGGPGGVGFDEWVLFGVINPTEAPRVFEEIEFGVSEDGSPTLMGDSEEEEGCDNDCKFSCEPRSMYVAHNSSYLLSARDSCMSCTLYPIWIIFSVRRRGRKNNFKCTASR